MSDPARFQFNLLFLLGATTWAAVSVALVNAGGWGCAPIAAAWAVILLNYQGRLRPWQTDSGRSTFMLVAVGLFCLSLGLPAVRVFGPIYGFQALLVMTSIGRGIGSEEMTLVQVVFALAVNAANLGMILAPFLAFSSKASRRERFMAIWTPTMVGPWTVLWNSEDVLVGYVVWAASFMAAVAAYPIGRRRLTVLAVVTGVVLLAAMLRD